MKQDALNIIDYTSQDEAKLQEILGGVIENIQTGAVSENIKAVNGSGTPESGSVRYSRFSNAELKDLGTSRTAGKGSQIEDKPVIVLIDTDKEIVEEVAGKDLRLYGVSGIAERRADNQAKRIKAFLDKKFFEVAVSEGTNVTTVKTNVQDIVDELIVKAKETSNDFIDGIDAEDLCLVLNPTYRKEMKKVLDELPNGTNPSNGAIGMYDSVVTYESTRLPQGVNAIVMLKGAIAQPYYVDETAFEKIPFIDSYAIENFLHCGTKALVADAIYVSGTVASL